MWRLLLLNLAIRAWERGQRCWLMGDALIDRIRDRFDAPRLKR